MSIAIRQELPSDRDAVYRINLEAFGQPEEADLVNRLRDEGAALLSLVAEHDGQLAGHILFTRMWIDTSVGSVDAVALAPMAVLPAYQRHGIGSALVREGLAQLRTQGESIVLVLGHAEYYPRFGFSNPLARPLQTPFSPDHFFALELKPSALDGVAGGVRYHCAFGI